MAGDGLLSRIEEIENAGSPEKVSAPLGAGSLSDRLSAIESGLPESSPGAPDEAARARANLLLDRSPEDATRALRLSRETGATVQSSARNPGVLERGLVVEGLAEMSVSAPQLHAVLAGDPVTARAVSDSLKPLTAWESTVEDMREFVRNTMSDPLRRVGFGWIAQLGGAKQATGEDATTKLPALTEQLRPEYERLFGGLSAEQQEEVASRRAYNREVLTQWQRLQETAPRAQALADEGALQAELASNLREFYAPPKDAPGWQVFLGEATESIVGNTLPTMLLGVGGGAIAGNVGRVLGGAAGLGGMFAQVYGDKYQELRREGYSATDADVHATVYGLTETIPEMLPVSIALGPGRVGLRNAVQRILETAGAEGATEALTEVLQIGYESGVLGEDVGGLGEMVGRVVYAAALGATVGGGMGAIGAAAGLQQDRTVAQELERQLDIQRSAVSEQLATAEKFEAEVTERERARAGGEVELSQEQIGQLEADRAEADRALAEARKRAAAIEARAEEGRKARDTQELFDITLAEANANAREAALEQERVASMVADATRDHVSYAQQQEVLDNLIAIAEETPARLRDEELFLSVTDGSGLAYIDAQVLRSALTNPEATEGLAEPVTMATFFQLVPEAQSQFEEAVRIGGDLVLPLNRVVSAMATSKPLRELVKDATRLTPEAMSTAEFEEVLESTVTPAMRATADKEAIREKVSAFKRRAFSELRRAGQSAKSANLYADTFATFYRTQMTRLQGSPEALARLDAMMDGLSVQSAARRDMRASVESGVTLDQLREFFQSAWHGSPHLFDEFKLAAMGTGEGAQAYGWGLYFAENKEIADYYRTKLQDAHSDLKPPPPGSVAAKLIDLYQFGDTWAVEVDSAREVFGDIVDTVASDVDGVDFEDLVAALATPQSSFGPRYEFQDGTVALVVSAAGGDFWDAGVQDAPKSALYEVEIPDEAVARFLDWDAPLSEQPEAVKQALAQAWAREAGVPESFAMETLEATTDTGGQWYRNESASKAGRLVGSPIGSASDRNDAAQSAWLLNAGIPGIKYLDAGSRDTGEGTRNLVVFDESLITIKTRNGEPIGKVLEQAAREQGTLVVQHNLSEANLLHAAKMGGLAAPSIAVTQGASPLESFGEITLIGSRDMADPSRPATRMFGADIYSPRYPSVEYEIPRDKHKEATAWVKEGQEATGWKVQWDEVANRGANELKNSPAVMWEFLSSSGETPAVVMTAPVPEETVEKLRAAGFEPFFGKSAMDLARTKEFNDLALPYVVAEYEKLGEEYSDFVDKVRESYAEAVGFMPFRMAVDVAKLVQKSGEDVKVDALATRESLRRQIEDGGMQEKFFDYVDDKFDSFEPSEKLFAGFTASGNRRYIPHTIENVIKSLKKDLRGGENFNYGVGSVRAKYTKEFKSVAALKKSENRLVTKAQFDKVKEEIDAEFEKVAERVLQDAGGRRGSAFGGYDAVASAMSDAARMGVPRALRENGFDDVSAETQQMVAGFLMKLRDMPTEYFEGKLLRRVALAEFEGAVVPHDIGARALAALKDAGVERIETYQRGDSASRAAAVGKFSRVFFQDQDDVTRTPAFREWFGGSKVVDEDGRPLVVHHSGSFDEESDGAFRASPAGIHFGNEWAALQRVRGKIVDDFISDLTVEFFDDPDGETGFVWSSQGVDSYDIADPFETEEEAREHALKTAEDQAEADAQSGEDPLLTRAYLSIQNPKRVPDVQTAEAWAEEIEKAKAEGYDGLIYANRFEDAGSTSYVAFDPGQIKSVNNRGTFSRDDPRVLFQGPPPPQPMTSTDIDGQLADGTHPGEISERNPTGARSTEDPLADFLSVGVEPTSRLGDRFMQMATTLKTYPGFVTRKRKAEAIVEDFVQFVEGNLLFLYDNVDPSWRERASHWYDGARAVTTRWSEKYGIPDVGIAGALAALSPQKDWFTNVSLAERVLDIHTRFTRGNWRGYIADAAQRAKAQELYVERKGDKLGADDATKLSQRLDRIFSRPYEDQETDVERAIWLRSFDELYNQKGFRVLTPEGEFVGEPKGKIAWGSNAEISKAIGMLSNPSREYVSQNISREHKVRNFYNNILAPMSPRGSVTIDTHAIAAALIRALAGGSTEVLHNFAGYVAPPGLPSMKSSVLGVSGTYGLYAEAYRRAAAKRGILPRQMQSITWEAVRTLFPAEDKRGSLPARIDAIWMRHQKGELSLEQARLEVVREAGGISAPEWTGGSDSGLSAASRDASYEGELSEDSVAGGSAEGGARGVPAGGAGLREGAQGQAVALSTREQVRLARDARQRSRAMRGRTFYQSGEAAKEIASARSALQWTEHETSKGPLYEGLSVSLVPSGADWGMGDEWSHLRVLDHESGKLVGDLVLAMEGGVPVSLNVLSFDAEHQGRGLGQDVVEMLLANVEGEVAVSDILDESQGFWRRMGAYGYSEDGRDARLSWDSYAAARLLPPRQGGERPAIAAGRAVDGGPDLGAQALVGPVGTPAPAGAADDGAPLRLRLAAGDAETAAATRRAENPDAWLPREHFEVAPEGAADAVEVDPATIYDIAADPLDLRDIANDEADTAGGHPATILERLVQESGFDGYRLGDVVARFTASPAESVGAPARERKLGQRRDGPRGQIRFEGDRSVITVFETADFSTVIHEASHFFLEAMSVIAAAPDAPAEFVADYQAALRWMGNNGEPLTVEQHEQFARGGEAYFLEGKAPSSALRRMFRTFRAWLERVYESAVALDVTLTDEVRGVFDRMLASREEIDALRDVEVSSADPNFLTLLTPAERRAYLSRREEQFERAKEVLLAKLIRQVRRERKNAWRDERESLRATVTADVDAEPVYQAIHWLQTGKRLDGKESALEPAKLDRAELARDFHPMAVSRLPRGVTAKSGGVSTDLAAEWFGFSSGAELVAMMSAATPRRRLIEQRLDEEMRRRHGDMLSDGSIREEAEASLAAADRTGEVLYVLQVLARRAGKPAATREFYEAEVDRMLASMPVGEVMDSRRYRTAEVRAARKVGRHLARGNLELAAAAKREQLIQHILYRRSIETREMVDKTRARFARYVRPQARGKAKVDEEYHQTVQRLVATVDMGPRRPPPSDQRLARMTAEALSAWMAKRAEADGAVFLDVPDSFAGLARPTHFKEMSLEDFSAFVDVVDNVYAQGRMLRSVVIEGRQMELAAIGSAISGSVRENVKEREYPLDTTTPSARRGQLARGFFYSLLKARSIIRKLDGGVLGPLHRFVMRAMDRAEVEKTRRMQQVANDLDALFKKHLGRSMRGMSAKMIYVPEVRMSMSRASMLAVALNLGNSDNRTKLLEGRKLKGSDDPWSQEQVDAILRNLTRQDLAFVNAVWEYIDSYWPEIAALERRTMGITPAKVEAEPFQVTLANGETVQMRGGYYPLRYDSNVSPRAQDVVQESIADIMQKGRFASAQTRQGHTQARVSGVREPVRLDLGVLSQHLEQVVTDLTMREATVNAYRILNRRDVANAIAETMGVEAHQMLSIWAQDVAVGNLVAGGSIEHILDSIRAGVSVATMGFKFSTMMAQVTGFTHSVVRIGPMNVLRGLWAVTTGFGGAGVRDRALTINSNVRAVYEKSEFMRQRATTFHRDVRDALRAMERKGEIRGAIAKAGFWPIVKMQAVVDVVTWLGAYHQGLKNNPDSEAAAVEFADRMIIESQGSGYMKDLSGIERGSIGPQSRLRPAWRLWTAFYSYFNTKLNLAYMRAAETDFRKPRDVARLAADYFLLFFVEAVLAEVILGRAPDPDDDDEDGWLLWSAKLAASSTLATIPVLSQISGALQGFDAAPAGLRGLDTIARGAKEAGEAAAALAMDDEELDVYQLARAINGAGGVIFKYPASQTNQVLRAMEQMSEGEDVTLWDFLVYQEK